MKGKLAMLALYGALLTLSAPPWPDDWDGLGFVAAVSRFDMDAFSPHPPGYPVYVAAAKLFALVVGTPLYAACAVSALSGIAVAALVWSAAARIFGPARAWAIAIAVSLAPLAWRASSGVGTEGLALAFAALAVFGLAHARGSWLGIAVGLGLGVRLSWAPLYLALLVLAPKGARLRAGAAAMVATAAWSVPLVALVGAAHLRALLETHLAGHATRWGGTAISDPGAERLVYFARDLVVDGLGAGTDTMGLILGLLIVMVATVGITEWRRDGWPHARTVAIALGPYAVWIALGQNLRQQPRHALPLVAALAGALALAAMSADRGRRLGVALVGLMSLRTLQDAHGRKTIAPPGAQLVLLVRELPRPDRVAVFGGPSMRFFAGTELAGVAHPSGSMGDVRLALDRMPALPARVLVTREIGGYDSPPYPAAPFKSLCRPERLDRRAPCLDVAELRVPYLPKE